MESADLRHKLAQLHKSAFGWAMVCCDRNRDLAAEVLQQAYCRILSRDASFGGKSEFSTWVFGVIRHVAFEEMRKQQRRCHLYKADADVSRDAIQVIERNHDKLVQRELAEHLQAALGKLSERQREVLHLTFYEEMTIEQAASVLEITVGSARQHYQRGKASLRRILSAHEEMKR